jgi:hypothetical protein
MKKSQFSKTNTMDFITSLSSNNPSIIRSAIYKKGVLSSYNDEDGRMVLYTSKNTRFSYKLNSNMWLECNGFVLDTVNMKPLVIPQHSFKSNVTSQTINKYLMTNMYNICLIEDGTVINLYYWKPLDRWCISTTRGYDVTNIKWGKHTYKQILEDLLKKYNTTANTFYNSLDKDKCYTFGFKHDSMHPFKEGGEKSINKLWFIQSCLIESPLSIIYDFQGLFGIFNQPIFNAGDSDCIDFKYLHNSLHNSLHNYMLNNTVNYGFILRSKDYNLTKEYSCILLESKLMQKIRQLCYHSDFNNYANEMNHDRELSTIIYSYLNINNCNIFIKLFPQYNKIYKLLTKIRNSIVANVIKYANQNINSLRDTNQTHDYKKLQLNTHNQEKYMHVIVAYIYKKINIQCFIDTNNKYITQQIISFISNKQFIKVYYNMVVYNIPKGVIVSDFLNQDPDSKNVV